MTLLKDKKSEDAVSINSSNLESPGSITKKIQTGEYRVAVYGLGHVGAPIASSWLRTGMTVIGVDKSQKVMENAKNGAYTYTRTGCKRSF